MNPQHEAFLSALSASLDADAAAHHKAGAHAHPKTAAAPAAFGADVIAVIRGLVLTEIPWTVLISQVLPDVLEMKRNGKDVVDILAAVTIKWLTGGYPTPKAAAQAP